MNGLILVFIAWVIVSLVGAALWARYNSRTKKRAEALGSKLFIGEFTKKNSRNVKKRNMTSFFAEREANVIEFPTRSLRKKAN